MDQPDRIDQAEVHLAATPEQVFAAFADPARVARWMPPEGMRAEVGCWQVVAGAPYRMALVYTGPDAPEGKAGGGRDEVKGLFVTVEPPHRVLQEAEFPSDDPANSGVMRLEWRFEPAGEGTMASVRASSVPRSIDPGDHRQALAQTLEQLGQAARPSH